jgi:hypothetical protein
MTNYIPGSQAEISPEAFHRTIDEAQISIPEKIGRIPCQLWGALRHEPAEKELFLVFQIC